MEIKKIFNLKKVRGKSGQSLLELLIAIAVLSITLGAALIVIFGNQSLFLDKKLAAKASASAAEGLEATQAIWQRSWDELTLGQHGLVFLSGEWQFSGTQDVSDIFTRTINITSPETNVKDVTSTVSWQTDPLRPLSIQLTMRFTNWQGLFGDWQNPQTFGTVDLGPGNQGTDLKVRNKIVYMTAEASAAAKPDFFIIDATNGASPFIVSSLNTGPSLNAVDISGSYAYVANRSGTAQLQIINIINISSPTLAVSYQLPGNNDWGLSIFVLGNYAYVGTDDDSTGPEFYIINVSTPTAPSSVSSFEIGDAVNAIYVKDNKAYLATASDYELWVLDVSNPSTPALITKFDAPGNSEDGKAIDIVGTKLYLGRLLGGNHSNHHELHILDITNLGAITSLGSLNLTSSINDLLVRDYLVFLATDDSNNEFKVYNISNPANITLWSSFNYPQVATALDYENNIVYTAVRSNDALRIITSQ